MATTTKKEFRAISPYGYILDDKVYLKGYLDTEDREIGVVRESEEQSMQYFVDRFDMATAKIDDVKSKVSEVENKGSFLMKLIHMRTYLAEFNGLGDFEALLKQIDELEKEILVYIEENREKNYQIKKQIIREVDEFKDSTDWKDTTLKFKEAKQKWIKTGSAHKEIEDSLNTQFNDIVQSFIDRKKAFVTRQALLQKQRVDAYYKIIGEMRRLNMRGPEGELIPDVKKLQEDWKNVGKIIPIKYKKLHYQFRKELDKFFRVLKGGAPEAPRKTGIALKKEVLEMTEHILKMGSPFHIGKVKQYQGQWKQVGKLLNPEDRELNLKFRIICNEIFESHFLDRTAINLYDHFTEKTPGQQLTIKIDLLEKSIVQDSKELNEFNQQHGYELEMNPRDPRNSKLMQERNNYVNKLKTKQRILKKLQEQVERV